jgi:hypothetical protein
MKAGQRVKCVKRMGNDISATQIGRYGTIVKRGCKEGGIQTYVLRMNGRSSFVVLREDEIVAVKTRGNKGRS